jgi:hypothetical protein
VSALVVSATVESTTAVSALTVESAAGVVDAAGLQEAKAKATTQNNNTFFITLNFKNLTC